MEGAWCLEAMTHPVPRTTCGCRQTGRLWWQLPAPAGCLANLSRSNCRLCSWHNKSPCPSASPLPLLLKLCFGRKRFTKTFTQTHPMTTALLRKMIHWCLKIPQTGALTDFMTDFPRRHWGQQWLMLHLASTPCEYLSAITTDSRAQSLHIILLFVHKFPLKGFQHPHTASSQAFRLLKPSQPDRMVPRNYKQCRTIFITIHGTILSKSTASNMQCVKIYIHHKEVRY